MGPDSGKPGGAVAGLSIAELTAAWEKPFQPVEDGGCPPLEPMTPWFEDGP